VTWRGMSMGAALVATLLAAPCSPATRRAARPRAYTIHLLSAIPEHRRYLTMEALTRAMRACTFFGAGNPLRDINGRSPHHAQGGSYGATCRGRDALAPEIKVTVDPEERRIEIDPDFSDAIVNRFAAALKAQDHAAITATFGPAFSTYRVSPDQPRSSYEGLGAEKFLAYFDHLKARYGNVTGAFCRKRRFVEPHFYSSLYNCFVYFERMGENERIWLSPDALEDGILTMEIDGEDPAGGHQPSQ